MDKIGLTHESYLHHVGEGGGLQAAILGSIERFWNFMTIVFWEHRTLKIQHCHYQVEIFWQALQISPVGELAISSFLNSVRAED